MIFPSDSISLSITSPALRNSAGFLCIPTPAGVPVKITSPGRSVIDLEEHKIKFQEIFIKDSKNSYCVNSAIISSILKINSPVFPHCFSIPLIEHLITKL